MMTADEILQKAREFRQEADARGLHVTWRDYEAFKTVLLHNKHYGYEGQLADILHL